MFAGLKRFAEGFSYEHRTSRIIEGALRPVGGEEAENLRISRLRSL